MVSAILEHHRISSATSVALGQYRTKAAKDSSTTANGTGALSRTEISTVLATLKQLNVPWSQIFDAIESASSRDIALLSISPDIKKESIIVTAEARNVGAMLRYSKALASRAEFKAARLIDHEMVNSDNGNSIRFNLTIHLGIRS
jgi:hypothetical protein